MKKSSRVSEIHLIEFLGKDYEKSNEEIKKERFSKGEVRLLISFEMYILLHYYLPNYLAYIIRKYVNGNLSWYFSVLKIYFKFSHNQNELSIQYRLKIQNKHNNV